MIIVIVIVISDSQGRGGRAPCNFSIAIWTDSLSVKSQNAYLPSVKYSIV